MFEPKFTITSDIIKSLMSIEANKEIISSLPITPKILLSLKETSKYLSTHYSTAIEGNTLTKKEVQEVIEKNNTPRERNEKEVMGYYSALEYVYEIAEKKAVITENIIKNIHGIVMSNGKNKRIKPTEYRDGQNVIKEAGSGLIVYMPPEAKDVTPLMQEMIQWIETEKNNIPIPVIAGIIHYQFATIHPYWDGNGRTARLLTTLVLHLNGYDMKGIYSLEEYYAKDLKNYYSHLSIGNHNYYMGRAEEDITHWIQYFCKGMEISFGSVRKNIEEHNKKGDIKDKNTEILKLDIKQRKVLYLFINKDEISSSDIALTLGVSVRTANNLCIKWQEEDFIKANNQKRKGRKYSLTKKWLDIL